jgi:ABC-2 type transport system permease protein
MRWRLRQFLAIAGLTALETVRQPITLLIAGTCVAFIGLLPILITHALGEGERLVRDSSLAFHLVCGLVLGCYAACSSLAREIRRGTASSVLSKPVGRELFLLAKFCGIATVMILFSMAAGAATLMSARTAANLFFPDWWSGAPLLAAPPLAFAAAGALNFFARRPFSSTAFGLLLAALAVAFAVSGLLDGQGHRVAFGALYSWNIVPATALVTLAILVLAGVAVRLDVVPTLSICSVVFLAGLMSDYLFGRHAAAHPAAAGLYRLLPNLQHFWVVDALSGEGGIPWSYVARAALYAAFYLAGVLSLGLLAFRHMEVQS